MGRSIVIFGPNYSGERFACANIEPDHDIIKYVNLQKPPKFVVWVLASIWKRFFLWSQPYFQCPISRRRPSRHGLTWMDVERWFAKNHHVAQWRLRSNSDAFQRAVGPSNGIGFVAADWTLRPWILSAIRIQSGRKRWRIDRVAFAIQMRKVRISERMAPISLINLIVFPADKKFRYRFSSSSARTKASVIVTLAHLVVMLYKYSM